MKHHTTTMTALLLAISSLHADPVQDAALGMITGGNRTGTVPAQINDNGRNAWVTSDGNGSGVIYNDRGPTYIQKVGDTTFIVPTANPPAPGAGRQR